MGYRVGVDIGGTFIDFCVFDEATQAVHTLKVLTTPDRPGEEVMEGLRQLRDRYGVQPEDIVSFTHGTTVGINTVIQRRGAPLALLTTEGFGDVLELARLRMPQTYSLFSSRPAPLIGRDMVFPVGERMLADGTADRPVDEASVLRAIEAARRGGAAGIIVALLHAYRNQAHEQAVKALIARHAPELFVFCSAEIWPVIREYERTTTAVINGYVHPRVSAYLSSLQAALVSSGVTAAPMITKSNGGVMGVELGKTHCVGMVLSGTASGVIGAAHVAAAAGVRRAITLDIGGTSADVALILDGAPQFGMGERIGDFPLYIPSVSVSSIGEGGGSIAWVDDFGVLKVGPESAGSTPGPACYGRGGTRATITDAFVVCGFMGQAPLGYNAVAADIGKAEAAVAVIAAAIGLGLRQAAEAIIRIAISGMFMEVNKLIARYGVDVRDLALLPFGGAGPMMGCFLARELGITRVLIPAAPGVVSALGGLIADLKNDFVQTVFVQANAASIPALQAAQRALRGQGEAWIRAAQGEGGVVVQSWSADMRYHGQSFEIETTLEPRWIEAGDMAATAEAFHRQHQAIYDFCDRAAEVHIVNLRLVIAGATPKPVFRAPPPGMGAPAPTRRLDVWFDGQAQEVPLYSRAALRPGQHFCGPAVVAQDDTTTCIPGGFDCMIDAGGNIVLDATPMEAAA